MTTEINGRVFITNTTIVYDFKSAVDAEMAFERLRCAQNAPHMILWIRKNGRCDSIVFTPNGG